MKGLLIFAVIIGLIILIISLIPDECLNDVIKDSLWVEKETGDIVEVTNITPLEVWYHYVDTDGNQIGTGGNVDTVWFLNNFKFKK